MTFFEKGMNFLNNNSPGLGTTIAVGTLVVATSKMRQTTKEQVRRRQSTRLSHLHQGKINGFTYMREQTSDGRPLSVIAQDLSEFNRFAKVNKKYNGDSFQPEEYDPFYNFSEKYMSQKKDNKLILSSKTGSLDSIDSQKIIATENLLDSQSSSKKEKNEKSPFASLSYGTQIKTKSQFFISSGEEIKKLNEVMNLSQEQKLPEETSSTSQLIPPTYILPKPPFLETAAGEFVMQVTTIAIVAFAYVGAQKIVSYFPNGKKNQKELPESGSMNPYLDIVVAYNKKEINQIQAINLFIHFHKTTKDEALFLLLGKEETTSQV